MNKRWDTMNTQSCGCIKRMYFICIIMNNEHAIQRRMHYVLCALHQFFIHYSLRACLLACSLDLSASLCSGLIIDIYGYLVPYTLGRATANISSEWKTTAGLRRKCTKYQIYIPFGASMFCVYCFFFVFCVFSFVNFFMCCLFSF